jgi:HEAT repeat protein
VRAIHATPTIWLYLAMLQGQDIVATTRPNIWQLQSRRDIQALTKALQYPDPEVRKRAAGALRVLDAVQAVPALKSALRNETDLQVRTNLVTALHVLDHRTDINSLIKDKDVNGLMAALKSRHPENTIAAARALGELGDRIAVEPLVILFQNTSRPPGVRLAAAEALLQLKSAPAVVTLLGALRRDSWQVRRNAAAVLGQIQASWAVEPLIEALDDPHPIVRRTAAAALRRVGTAEAVAALRARFAFRPVETVRPAAPLPTPSEDTPLPAPPPEAVVAGPTALATSRWDKEKTLVPAGASEDDPAKPIAAARDGVSFPEESGVVPAPQVEHALPKAPSTIKRLIAFFKGRDGA